MLRASIMSDALSSLPLPVEDLPEALRRFCNPATPGPRRMVARGMVPLKGEQLVMVLLQLSADPEEEIATGAGASLDKLPSGILQAAASSELPAPFLMALALRFESKGERKLGALSDCRAVRAVSSSRAL